MTAAALAATLAAALLAADAPASTQKAAGAPASTPKAAARAPRLTPGKPVAPSPEPAVVSTRDRVAEDRLLTEQKCARCHDLSRAISTPLTESAWHAHLRRLGSGGAALSDDQVRRIRAYLKTAADAEKSPAPDRSASR